MKLQITRNLCIDGAENKHKFMKSFEAKTILYNYV